MLSVIEEIRDLLKKVLAALNTLLGRDDPEQFTIGDDPIVLNGEGQEEQRITG